MLQKYRDARGLPSPEAASSSPLSGSASSGRPAVVPAPQRAVLPQKVVPAAAAVAAGGHAAKVAARVAQAHASALGAAAEEEEEVEGNCMPSAMPSAMPSVAPLAWLSASMERGGGGRRSLEEDRVGFEA